MELYWVKTHRYPWWPAYVRMMENDITNSIQQPSQIKYVTNILNKPVNKVNNTK